MNLRQILQAAVDQEASDVVLKDGRPPMFRVGGTLMQCTGFGALTGEQLSAAAKILLQDDAHRMRFATERHADLAFDEPGVGRFRLHVFHQRGSVGMAVRVIPGHVRTVTELNLPPVIEQLASERRGLILVTGATGNGKTTTLSAMIEHINRTSTRHIITVEDPIEYVHHDGQSIICQREIGDDVNDFPSALQAALRENPDVIMLGEMRDLATVETAIAAAETGHLVLSTMHTADAPETIIRTISAFPEHHREQIRIVLAGVLRGVVSQRLLQLADGAGRIPAVEVMVGSLRVREYIEKQRVRELSELITQGHSYGMQSFDQSILTLYQTGRITHTEAVANCRNPADFEREARGFQASGGLRSAAPVGIA